MLFDVLYFFYKMVPHGNIDQILPTKLHGPMHYRIDVTCVYRSAVTTTIFVKKSNHLILCTIALFIVRVAMF